MKYIVAALSLTSTWGGFEAYHLMREEDFLSLNAILLAFISLGLIAFGSFLAKIAVGAK